MIPKIIHQSSPCLTWEENHLAARTRALMPDWTYRFWTDDDNHALLKSVLPHHEQTYLDLPAGVIRADIARCLYLYTHGGVYCDTDYIFYREPDQAFLANACVLGVEEDNHTAFIDKRKFGNALMASEPGFPLWLSFVEDVFKKYHEGVRDIVRLSGPHAITWYLEKSPEIKERITFVGPDILYPRLSGLNLRTEKTPLTIGGHLCWGSWRNKSPVQRIKNRARRILSAIMA